MATCEDCIYKPICDAYADFGVTDVPKSDLTPCELFKDKSRFVEVVRCGECKWYCDLHILDKIEIKCCNLLGLCRKCNSNDFCSYGEKKETVYCKDCKNLMFSDCYGECSKAYRGIVQPNDTCEYGERKENINNA